MIKALLFVGLLAVAACAQGEPLPTIEGPWTNLNPTMWQPSPAEAMAIQELPQR